MRWAIVAALDVVLAAPDDFHRAGVAGGFVHLGDVDRFDDVVRGRHGAAAETTAGHHRVQYHLFRLEAGGGGDGAVVEGLELRAGPHGAAVVAQVDHAVERLHRRMRQIGEFVDGFDLVRGAGQLRRVGLRDRHAGGFRQRLEVGQLLVAADFFDGAAIPVDDQRIAALLGRPVAFGDDDHAAAATVGSHLQHVDHTLDGFGFAGVEL